MSQILVMPIGDSGWEVRLNGETVGSFGDAATLAAHFGMQSEETRRLRGIIDSHCRYLHSRTPDQVSALDLREVATELRDKLIVNTPETTP